MAAKVGKFNLMEILDDLAYGIRFEKGAPTEPEQLIVFSINREPLRS